MNLINEIYLFKFIYYIKFIQNFIVKKKKKYEGYFIFSLTPVTWTTFDITQMVLEGGFIFFKYTCDMGHHIWHYVLFSICFEILSSNHSVSMRENMAANSSWWWKDSMGTSRWNTWTPSLTNNSIFYKSLHRISGRGF